MSLGSANPFDRVLANTYFTVAARTWDQLAQNPDHIRSYVAALATCGSPRRVVDVGTGSGHTAAAAAGAWPGAQVVGVDVSRAMLRRARARHHAPNLTFRRASVARLPFDDGSVDLLSTHNGVAWPPELRRVCAPDGHVVISSNLHPAPTKDSAVIASWREAGFCLDEIGVLGPREYWYRLSPA